MLLPLIVRESWVTGFLFFSVIFTVFRCVFMLMSTPTTDPCTTVPFFSSMSTVSPLSFIRNLSTLVRTTF